MSSPPLGFYKLQSALLQEVKTFDKQYKLRHIPKIKFTNVLGDQTFEHRQKWIDDDEAKVSRAQSSPTNALANSLRPSSPPFPRPSHTTLTLTTTGLGRRTTNLHPENKFTTTIYRQEGSTNMQSSKRSLHWRH